MIYTPPFKITHEILKSSQKIAKELGLIAGQKINDIPLKLRRTNNIKTVQASLAIEGNTLTLDQVTYLLEGKRVIGPSKDIQEVKNALSVYENLKRFDPLKMKDFLQAHKILMENLTNENGQWRCRGVGIFKGKEVSHIAPPAKKVPSLMKDLFYFLSHHHELSWLLKGCIFHYELEFIHPFADGNGRMGRLWQQLLLMKEDPVFEFIPVEVIIKKHQEEYYKTLEESDILRESTPFIEFSLNVIYQALHSYAQTTKPLSQDSFSRLNDAQRRILDKWLSRKDYINIHKDISTATASRDLQYGLKQGMIQKQGEKNQTLYHFVK